MTLTLKIWIIQLFFKIAINQQYMESEWQYHSSELIDNNFPSSGWNSIPPIYPCNSVTPPFLQFYDFTGSTWERNFDLTQEKGYSQVRIIFDLFIFQNDQVEDLPFIFKFDGDIISLDIHLVQMQQKPINFTYCSSRIYRDKKMFLDFQINTPLNTLNFNHQFQIIPLYTSTQFSIRNFYIFLNKCTPNCLQCQSKEVCQICKPNFQLFQTKCICSNPKPFKVNDDCLSSCPSGYFDFLDFSCKLYARKWNLLQDNVNQNITIYEYIKDTQSNDYYKKNTYEGDQNVDGPFRFNDKIKYQFTKSTIDNIIELDITFYIYGVLSDLSSIVLNVNQYQIETIKFTLNNKIKSRNGFIKQIQDCYRVGFTSCKKINYYITLQSFLEKDIILEIGSNFNISDPLQAWGIYQVAVNEIAPVTDIPQVCGLWYNQDCIDKCPTFSTQNGNICEDYGSVFKNPKYLLKEFYPNHIITDTSRVQINITTPEFYQFESRFLFLFNTNFQSGILKQKFLIPSPHRKLRLMISILLIDWQDNSQDYYLELVIGSNINQIKYKFYADSSKYFMDYQINEEFPDYIYRNYTIDINHNSKILNIELRCFSPQNGYCSFFDYFIIIEKCDHGCAECDQNGKCTKYDPQYEDNISYQLQNYQCLDGYRYENEQCMSCQQGCGKCDLYKCLQCLAGFVLREGSCHCLVSQTGKCLKQQYCHNQCLTCSNIRSHCESCDLSQLKVLNINTCVCMKGYYLNQNFDCIQCNQKCVTCNGFESCTSCNDLDNRQLNENICKCKQGYFEDEKTLNCQQCHKLCLKCYFQYDYCTECNTQIHRQLQNGKCICQIGYYQDNQQICQKCNPNCYMCDQANVCLSCDIQKQRILSKDYLCVCNRGYFENQSHLCEKCHHSCLNCNQSQEFNQCTSCPSTRIKALDKINVFECKCRKGYFDIGNLECMNCNLYINVVNSHPCYSYCGDKILQWNEECDDGNNDPNDGCNSCYLHTEKCNPKVCKNCVKGNCQNCIDGYYLNRNKECEQCSQSCITCINTSSNCLQCRFLFDDQKCKMCELEYGYQMIDEQCYAICGDTIVVDNEQCDDGNLIEGDGCNSQCMVEQGFICNPFCQIINPIRFKLISDPKDKYYSNKRYCYLEFNQDVIIDGDLIQMIKLQVNNSTAQFKSNITKLNLQSLKIEIEFLINIENPIVQIEIVTPEKIKSMQGIILQENIQTIQFLTYIYQDESTQIFTTSSSYIAYFIMLFLFSIAGFSFVIGGLNIFFNLLDSIQLLTYLKYFNVIFPYNVQIYFQTFGFAEFDFLKEYISIQLSIFNIDFDISENQPDLKFAEQGYSALFILNILSVLSVFTITFTILILSELTHKLCNRYIHYLHNQIQKDEFFILNIFKYYLYRIAKHLGKLTNNYNSFFLNTIIRTFMTVAMDFNMAIFLQLKLYKHDMRFSYYLGLFALIAQILFISYSFKSIAKKKYEFVTLTYKQKHESFLEGNPDIHQNHFVKYYNVLILIKKIVFMFTLIYFYHSPCFQISLSSIQNIIFLGYIVLIRPLKDINEFYKVILTECILWLEQLIILFIYYIQSRNNQLDQSQIEDIQLLGWFIIGLSLFMLLIQFFIDLKQHAQFLYQQYTFIQKLCKFVNRIFKQKKKEADQIRQFIKDKKFRKSRAKIVSFQMNMERNFY